MVIYLGYKINQDTETKVSEDDLFEWIEMRLLGSKYTVIEVSRCMYTGERNDIYVILKTQNINLATIENEGKELKSSMERIGLCVEGKFGFVGWHEVH